MFGISVNKVNKKEDNNIDNETGISVKNTNSYYNSINEKEDIRNAVAGKVHCLFKIDLSIRLTY